VKALSRIAIERDRQERLRASGQLQWVASMPDCPNELRLAALVEEVGEVARAMHDGGDVETELVQVAAVAVAWLEGLEAVPEIIPGQESLL
jgi:hypothetical protein